MKGKIWKSIIISVCVVAIALLSVALGLYSFGYMGFEDGKLHFYFSGEKPGDDPENPDEITSNTVYTIHLNFPDGSVVDYKYKPAIEDFDASSQVLKYETTN